MKLIRIRGSWRLSRRPIQNSISGHSSEALELGNERTACRFLQETDQDLLEFGQGEEEEEKGPRAKERKQPQAKADTGVVGGLIAALGTTLAEARYHRCLRWSG